MKAKELFPVFFDGYPFEDFSEESEMTKELWDKFDELLKDDVKSYLISKNLYYDADIITQGISDKAYINDFWTIEDYISNFYEPEYLKECAEEREYEYMISNESHYW